MSRAKGQYFLKDDFLVAEWVRPIIKICITLLCNENVDQIWYYSWMPSQQFQGFSYPFETQL